MTINDRVSGNLRAALNTRGIIFIWARTAGASSNSSSPEVY